MPEDALALPGASRTRSMLLNARLRDLLLEIENDHDLDERALAYAAIRATLDHVADRDLDAWLEINRQLADIAAETVEDVERALAARYPPEA